MMPKHLPMLERCYRRYMVSTMSEETIAYMTARYHDLLEHGDRERMFWRFPQPRHRRDQEES